MRKHIAILFLSALTSILDTTFGSIHAQDVSYTSYVSNTYSAWGGQKSYVAGSLTMAEYFTDEHFYNNAFSQEVTGLPVGVYEAEIYFNASTSGGDGWGAERKVDDGTTGYTVLIANDREVDVPVYNVTSITEPTLYTVQNIHVTDGTLRLGSRNNREAANWHIIRLKKLTYKGVDGNSLYYALFTLIRQARDQWELCTCQEHRDAIDYWVPQALNSTPSDDVGTLQDIYNGLQETITTSTSFEKTKKSRKANLANKLATWNNNWNVAGKLPTEAQWTILRPALIDAVLAKDLECNYTDMDNAASALNDALAQAKATAVTDILANESDTDRSKTTYRMDGRRLDNPTDRGIYIRDGRKIVVK